MKRIITISVFSCLLVAVPRTSHAQELVYDPAVEAQGLATVAKLIEEIRILKDQLEDMKRNSALMTPHWNTTTARLLAFLAELGQAPSVLYGHDGSQTAWEETYTEEEVFPHGDWLEHERARSHATMTTQQDLLRLLEERHHAFDQDTERLTALQEDVENATGRNQILRASAALHAEQVWQMHQLEQLVMVLGNAQITAAAAVTNEQAAREAQERYFLTDGGKDEDEAWPVPHESGL